MDFKTYQAAVGTTAIYPEAGTGSPLALAYVGLGLGEVGEVQGKLKKVIRDDGGKVSEEKRVALLGELGDVLWYVARCASELDASLDFIASMNVEKLQSRKDRGVLQGSGDNR
jgi:NTP pyrophosphatase (non-canonical NTP hydrolase)